MKVEKSINVFLSLSEPRQGILANSFRTDDFNKKRRLSKSEKYLRKISKVVLNFPQSCNEKYVWSYLTCHDQSYVKPKNQ
jgi:hypothetical protein